MIVYQSIIQKEGLINSLVYETGFWPAPRFKINAEHVSANRKMVEASEPVEDLDDRNA